MADPALVKSELARLAASATVESGDSKRDSDRRIIERAATAVDDLEAAASFVEDVGIRRLRRAVDSVESDANAGTHSDGHRDVSYDIHRDAHDIHRDADCNLRRDGQRALTAFERFSRAASADDANFHSAHGIPLREEGQASDT